jgi:hypothetical protein
VVTEDGLQIFSLKKRDLPPEAFIMGEKADPLGVAVASIPTPAMAKRSERVSMGAAASGARWGEIFPPGRPQVRKYERIRKPQ